MAGRQQVYPDFSTNSRDALGTTRKSHTDTVMSGHYSDERNRRHNNIIRHTLKGAKPMEKPFAIIITGGPTAGKSTLLKAMRKSGILPADGIVTINKKPFAELPEYHASHNARHPEKVIPLIDEYYDLMHYIIEAAANKRFPLVIEEHGDSSLFITKTTQMLKDAGYETVMIGMTTDADTYFHHENKRCERDKKIADHPWALDLHATLAEKWESHIEHFDVSLLCKRNAEGPPLSIISRAQKDPKTGLVNHTIIDRKFYEQIFKTWPYVNTSAENEAEAFRWGHHKDAPSNYTPNVGGSRERGRQGRGAYTEIAEEDIAPDSSFVERLNLFADRTIENQKER